MRFELIPHVGAGLLRFGMSVGDVRGILPAESTPFLKGPTSEHFTDAFSELGIHVFYDRVGRCEALEFGDPATPTLDGRILLAAPFSDLVSRFRTLDPNLDQDASGMTSYSFGVALYCPSHAENRFALVEGVFVFRRGYYDSPS